MTVSYASVHLLMSCQKRLCKALLRQSRNVRSLRYNFPAVIPAFLLTGSLDLELLMSVLERVSKPMQAGDNSPVCFQIRGMMHDSKTLGSSFSLIIQIFIDFPSRLPYFYLVPTFYFLSVISSTIREKEIRIIPSITLLPHPHTDKKLVSLCHIVAIWNT